MITEKLLKLPPWLVYEGVTFVFNLFINTEDEIRISYVIESATPDSPHLQSIQEHGCWDNPFNENSPQGFLWLYEGITNDAKLLLALSECKMFLTVNHLI